MYCYLALFPPHLRSLAKRSLREFPYVSDVLFMMMACDLTHGSHLMPYPVDGLLLHVDENSAKVGFAELVHTYLHTSYRIGYSKGYCYLQWLSEAGLGSVDQTVAARSLGACPSVFSVLMYIWRRGSCVRPLTLPVVTGNRMLHITAGGETLAFPELFMNLRGFVQEEYRIGAAFAGVDVVQCMLRTAGVSSEGCFREVVQKQLEDKNSDMSAALVQSVREAAQARLTAPKTTVYVRSSLDVFQQSELMSEFPELKCDFSKATSKQGHPMLAAYRVCNEAMIQLRMYYNDAKKIPADSEVFYKDVGGSLTTQMARKRYNTHSCLPVLSAKDSIRRSADLASIERMVNKDVTLQKIFGDEKLKQLFYCENKAQHCLVQARYLTFLDSIYDMTNTDVADAMDSAGAKAAYATMLFSSEMLTSTLSGEIPGGKIFWKKEGNDIVFHFGDDYSFAYVHNLKTYLQPVTQPAMLSSRGFWYVAEITERRGPYVVMRINKLIHGFPETRLRVYVPTEKHLKDMLWVRYWDYDPVVENDKTLANFKENRVMVARQLWDRMLSYAIGLTVQKFSMNDLYAYARSANTRLVVNGTDVLMTKPMCSEDLLSVCQAVYMRAFVLRFNSSTALGVMTEKVKEQRYSQGGFFVTVWRAIQRSLGNIVDTVVPASISSREVIDDADAVPSSLYRRLLAWMAAPRLFQVDIHEAVAVTSYEVELGKTCIKYTNDLEGMILPLKQPPHEPDVINEIVDVTVGEVLRHATGEKDLNRELVRLLTDDAPESGVSSTSGTLSVVQGAVDSPSDGGDSVSPVLPPAGAPVQEPDVEVPIPHCVAVDCVAELTERAVKGDGNCLFYRLLSALPGYNLNL